MSATKKEVTINAEQKLFVIPCGEGYTCLGFDVCHDRLVRLARELRGLGYYEALVQASATPGTIESYKNYDALSTLAMGHTTRTGYRFTCELDPKLIGHEGKQVRVVNRLGETETFWLGKTTGWIPCHLAIKSRKDNFGEPVWSPVQSVTVLKERR